MLSQTERTRVCARIEYQTRPQNKVFYKGFGINVVRERCAQKDSEGRCTSRPLLEYENPPCEPGAIGCDPVISINCAAPEIFEVEAEGDNNFDNPGY